MMRLCLFSVFIVVLLSFGFRVNAQEQERDLDFELIWAAYDNDFTELEALLAVGADVNSKTDDSITALMYAAQNGHVQMLELLIRNGADVNAKPVDGFTALISACLFGHLEAAIVLIENGADINAQNMYGATSLMIAAAYGHYIITDMLLFYEAHTEMTDEYGNTALMIAAAHGYDDIVQLLLDAGAFINVADLDGITPLMAAVIRDRVGVVKLLLSYNAEFNNANNDGYTPLMHAVRHANDTLVKVLLDAGADTDLVNKNAYSAEKLALINNNYKLFKLIQKHNERKSYRPFVHGIYVNPLKLNIGFKDVMMENVAGIGEARYNTIFYVGHGTRIGHKRIWVPQGENLYYQYHEKRSYLVGGARKKFNINLDLPFKTIGFDLGVRYVYSYGNIRGTEKPFEKQNLIVPEIGFYFSKYGNYGIRLGYEYMDFGTYKLSPHRLTLSYNFYIGLHKNPKYLKHIYWMY